MKLEKPLAIFDLETTDADAATCAIVEYGGVLLMPDGTRKSFSKRFKPWKPIPPEATAVHGITNEDVADCPPFADYAARILGSLNGKDLAGYNLNRFDIICLDEEMRRCGLRLDLTGVRVIDAQVIYFKKMPRTLGDAVREYCGREPAGEHGAANDANDTADVLLAQCAVYPDLAEMSIDELATYSRMSEFEPVDIAGKLYRDADGHVRFAFGKNKDKRVIDQRGYADWMINKADFPGSTVDALMVELARTC